MSTLTDQRDAAVTCYAETLRSLNACEKDYYKVCAERDALRAALREVTKPFPASQSHGDRLIELDAIARAALKVQS